MSDNPDWNLKCQYDYRFGALSLAIQHKGENSPPYILPLREILKSIPIHEAMAIIALAEDKELPPEHDIAEDRIRAIVDTDLKDKVVLDIGGYDGWAAKEALDCGASRAIVLDNHQYEHYGWEEKKFEGVEYRQGDFQDWAKVLSLRCIIPANAPYIDIYRGYGDRELPIPDVIIFYNVLYHLKNPWAALDHLRELIKADGTMLLCTLFRYNDGPWMYVYEPRECNPTDETVYFGPSLSALERLLKATGWDAERLGLSYDRVVYRCKPTPNWERKHEDS